MVITLDVQILYLRILISRTSLKAKDLVFVNDFHNVHYRITHRIQAISKKYVQEHSIHRTVTQFKFSNTFFTCYIVTLNILYSSIV